MKEKQLYSIFKRKIKEFQPDCFCYKIPDGFGGGLRPFDMILIIRDSIGVVFPVAIEFKMKGKKPTPYQSIQLQLFKKAGGISKVYTYGIDSMDEFILNLIN